LKRYDWADFTIARAGEESPMVERKNRLTRRVGGRMALVFVMLLAGCTAAPAGPGAGQSSPAGSEATREAPRSARPRVTVIIGAEVDGLATRFGGGGTFSSELHYLSNSPLSVLDPQGQPVLRVAADFPSRDAGTWTVNADGTMRTTWRIKPNAVWHDGKPITSADFVFAHRVYLDPQVPISSRQPEEFMGRIEPVDDQSFVIHWKRAYPWAAEIPFYPLPTHLMSSVYESSGGEALVNHPFWTSTDYVGNGPFRLMQWDRGTQLVYQAFPEYFMGRPRLDEVVFRIMSDPNTVVASLLGGNGDATVGITLGQQGGVTMRNQWTASGEGQVTTTPIRWRYVQIQFDPQRNGQPALLDRRVRRALYHGIDRESMAEITTQGTATAAEVPLFPKDPIYPRAEQAITKYPFDPTRALALLQEAGWTRRGDTLVGTNGQPFALDLWTTAAIDNEREVSIVAADLDKLGLQTTQLVIPQSRIRDSEYRVSFPGLNFTAQSIDVPGTLGVAAGDRCPTAQNRFSGGNRGCWKNAEFDRQYLIASTSLERAERDEAVIQSVRVLTEEVGLYSLSYNTENLAMRKGLVGPGPRWPGQTGNTWNIHEWHWTQ
jgi:peptide/nickel transport system substrate-binding protein